MVRISPDVQRIAMRPGHNEKDVRPYENLQVAPTLGDRLQEAGKIVEWHVQAANRVRMVVINYLSRWKPAKANRRGVPFGRRRGVTGHAAWQAGDPCMWVEAAVTFEGGSETVAPGRAILVARRPIAGLAAEDFNIACRPPPAISKPTQAAPAVRPAGHSNWMWILTTAAQRHWIRGLITEEDVRRRC